MGTRDASLWRAAPAYAWEQLGWHCSKYWVQSGTTLKKMYSYIHSFCTLGSSRRKDPWRDYLASGQPELLYRGHHRLPLLAATLFPSSIQLDRHQKEGVQHWEEVAQQVCLDNVKLQYLLWNKPPVEETAGKCSGQRWAWETLGTWVELPEILLGQEKPTAPLQRSVLSQGMGEPALLLLTCWHHPTLLRCVPDTLITVILPY